MSTSTIQKPTQEKILLSLIGTIAGYTGEAINREDAKNKGLDKFLAIENAPVYGGWRVIKVGMTNGAHHGAWDGNGTEARLKFSEMRLKLESIITGIRLAKSQNID